MHIPLAFAFALGILASPALAGEPETVAVSEFQVTESLRKMEPEIGLGLAALASGTLDDRFRVVDREKVVAVLAGRDLEPGILFDSAEKAALLGEALGVKRVFVGLATTFGSRTVVHLKCLDVAARRFVQSETVTCTALEELPDLMPPMVRKFWQKERAPRIAVKEPTEKEVPKKPKPEPASAAELIGQLDSDDPGGRFSAAVELGRSGDEEAVRPLMRVLREDTDTFVRRAAARSLGELDAWEAVPTLIESLRDKEFFVAITVHKALEKITGQDFGFREGLPAAEVDRLVRTASEWWDAHRHDRDRK